MTKRICMVCLPRTGSAFIGEILCELYGLTNLIEPFSDGCLYFPSLTNGLFGTYSKNVTEFIPVLTRVSRFLDLLNESDKTQSLLLKLFLDDSMIPILPEILSVLRQNGFEFIKIRRKDREQHLLSFGIACQTNIWYTDQITNVSGKVSISIPNIIRLDRLRNSFDDTIKEFNIEGPDVWYESARDDISHYSGYPTLFVVPSKIMRLPDPYDQILNSEEVRKIINDK